MRRTVRRGFTLLEVLMVTALLALLAALAWPDFHTAARGEQLRESGQRFRALVAMCRAEAMNETVRYRLKIRPDGSLHVLRQADPLLAPHLYITPRVDWARTAVLLEDVWIEGVQLLPEGPPPIRIIDERLQFPESEILPTPVQELEQALLIDLDPDGTFPSLRLVLRDAQGRALLLTLDGRVGRVLVDDWPAILPEDALRPEPLEKEEEPEFKREDYAW
jgi:prepilin-type N-terminal cleavage/methylation domain-containing protein